MSYGVGHRQGFDLVLLWLWLRLALILPLPWKHPCASHAALKKQKRKKKKPLVILFYKSWLSICIWNQQLLSLNTIEGNSNECVQLSQTEELKITV